jgi:hypothetical protein
MAGGPALLLAGKGREVLTLLWWKDEGLLVEQGSDDS